MIYKQRVGSDIRFNIKGISACLKIYSPLYNTRRIDNILYFYDFVQNTKRITYLDVVIFIQICCGDNNIICKNRYKQNNMHIVGKTTLFEIHSQPQSCRKLEGNHHFTSSHFRFVCLPLRYIIPIYQSSILLFLHIVLYIQLKLECSPTDVAISFRRLLLLLFIPIITTLDRRR